MPRIKCPKCTKVETILKSGTIRNKQRYFCKECNYNFTLNHENRKAKNKTRKNYQTTLHDIAKAMGISITTVSRALRDYPDISQQTKDEVNSMVKEMDYHPNLLARSFASNHTQTIGVIIPNLRATFFSSMVGGIQEAASLAGYKVILCQSDENLKTEMDNIQLLIDNRVEALFICHSIQTETFDNIKLHLRRGTPIIHFYRVAATADTSKVMAKNTEGAELVTQHLIDQGCKRIAVIAGPKNLLITKERLNGYQHALKKNHLSFNQKLIAFTDFSNQAVISAVNSWMSGDEIPDGIFSISDHCAIIAIKHLKSIKISVPENVKVAGFGNDLMGELTDPSLTTYDVKTINIGKAAVSLFLNQLLAGELYKKETVTIEGELIIREST